MKAQQHSTEGKISLSKRRDELVVETDEPHEAEPTTTAEPSRPSLRLPGGKLNPDPPSRRPDSVAGDANRCSSELG